MTKREILQRLKGQLTASCQVYKDNLLYDIENMVTTAKHMLADGAKRIRACWPENIRAIRALIDTSLIGINGVIPSADTDFYDSVFIAPNYESVVAAIEAGCDVVVLDGTLQGRNEKELTELVQRSKTTYPDIVLMADLATVEEGIICEKVGFNIFSSTLSGYTRDTMYNNLDGLDIQLTRELEDRANCPVNGEGKIWDSKQLHDVQAAGADVITTGSAVTNSMKTIAYLIDQMKKQER